jgi:hypothetical protein
MGRTLRRLLLALVLVTAAGILAPVAGKSLWASAILSTDEHADWTARRRYLMRRLGAPTYAHDTIAAPDDGLFEGEWRLGALSMTAAAVTNMAFEIPETRDRARQDVALLIERALEPDLRSFDTERWNGEDALSPQALAGPNGHIGYLGHLAFMLGTYRVLGGDDRHEALHAAVTGALARRMREQPHPYLETYPGERYTCDNAVVAAALALRDDTQRRPRRPELAAWITHTRAHLIDPDTNLIVFGVADDGSPLQGGRGSATGWNAFYLPFVDEALAREQRVALRRHLVVDLPFGASGVREHPHGSPLGGDVDSGPLVFGLSPSGTGFSLAAARHDGDEAWLRALLRTAEVAGGTNQSDDGSERWYVAAPLVGDAIVLAMRTARPWDDRFLVVDSPHAQASASPSPSSFLPGHRLR